MQDEWVISRVFQKSGTAVGATVSGGGKKTRLSSSGINLYHEVSSPSATSLPPLLDSSSYANMTDRDSCSYDSETQREHVPCFSTSSFNPHPPFQLAPPHSAMNTIMDPRNAGFSAFPSLRSLQENLQLPLFFSTAPAPSPGQGGAAEIDGCGSFVNWVGQTDQKVDGSRLGVGPTELDCMWTF